MSFFVSINKNYYCYDYLTLICILKFIVSFTSKSINQKDPKTFDKAMRIAFHNIKNRNHKNKCLEKKKLTTTNKK